MPDSNWEERERLAARYDALKSMARDRYHHATDALTDAHISDWTLPRIDYVRGVKRLAAGLKGTLDALDARYYNHLRVLCPEHWLLPENGPD